ncbi:MAG: hypothetical protein SFH39_00650 [Candidatus Magnetobacterium sp. LHC-1]|nr:hypothetical protein [Nitrospirota bacterium]
MATTTDLAKGNVTIEFKLSCAGAGKDKGINVEADSTLNPDCIKYGDLAYFRVYHWGLSKGYNIQTSDTSISVASSGSTSEDKEESISFANTDSTTVSYPIDSINSVTWFGNNLGTVLATGKTELKASKVGLAAATIKYTTSYSLHSFTVTPKTSETYPVIVYIEENPS